MANDRHLPGWLVGTGWAVLGTAALGLPVALVVALLDSVRRTGSSLAQGVVLAGLVLLGVVLVVAAERGISHAAREASVGTALGIAAVLALLVLLGVLLPTLGLVLLGLGVVVGTPVAFAGVGYLAWWRWQHGPRPQPRTAAPLDEVRARAEQRRAAVRARHELTREAVRRGLIGPGFTRAD